jgi:serine/threonine-protein kinase
LVPAAVPKLVDDGFTLCYIFSIPRGAGSLTRDDPSAFAPPPAFGPFRVLHQIGVGALGPVFRTYEPDRDRLVAVKVFRLDVTPEQAQALADEFARAAGANLFHPSIVEPIAAGVEGTVAYRAEEYVAAESLDVAMRHYAPAALDKALPFITQLAGALDFARAAGFGHGALHPRDVFVTPDEARATGFGVVQALEAVGLRAPVRRPYTAPERIAGRPWGIEADVFSLAAIAFELLTGRRPAGTGAQIGPLAGTPAGAPALQMQAVLARAMEDEPSRRYPSALAFASALEAAARGSERPADPASGIGASAAVPAAAAAAAASARVPDPVAEAEPEPEEDIAVERDEDDAHHELTLREQQQTAESEGPMLLDDEPEAEADRFMTDAAALAMAHGPQTDTDSTESIDDGPQTDTDSTESIDDGPQTNTDSTESIDYGPQTNTDTTESIDYGPQTDTDSTESIVDEPELYDAEEQDLLRGVPALATAPDDDRYREVRRPAPVFQEGGATVFREPSDPSGAAEEPARDTLRMLPLAVALIIGLLLGFAAGYGVRARSAAPALVQNANPEGSRPQAPAGKDWSEQAVTPPAQAQPPRPAEPPAVPPEAQPDAPPGAPDAGRVAIVVPASGRIVVRSNPGGAGVTVNGRWRGRTPLTLDDLPFARYSVRVVQPGFAVASEDVQLSAADPARTLSFALRRSAPPAPASRAAAPPREPAGEGAFTGSLYVDSRPRGARVLLDGKPIGTTPLRLPEVPIGAHVVRLELAEHTPWTASTRIAAGQESRVTGSLDRIR